MAERVTDLRDVGRRMVAELLASPSRGSRVPETAGVLVADDLAPADTAGLDPTIVLALVTELGGPTSHTAIIARQLGLPCVVAADIARHPGRLHRPGRRHDGRHHRRPRSRRRAGAVAPSADRLRRRTGLDRPWTDRGRSRRSLVGERAGWRLGARSRRRSPARASACSAPSCASSVATPSRASRSRRRSTPRCSRRSADARS